MSWEIIRRRENWSVVHWLRDITKNQLHFKEKFASHSHYDCRKSFRIPDIETKNLHDEALNLWDTNVNCINAVVGNRETLEGFEYGEVAIEHIGRYIFRKGN